MAYVKVHADWKDYPDTTTPVDQAALEQIETGIFNAAATADSAITNAATAQTTADGKAGIALIIALGG